MLNKSTYVYKQINLNYKISMQIIDIENNERLFCK